MIVNLGQFTLILALFVSLMQAAIPLAGAARHKKKWMLLGRHSATTLFGLVSVSFAALIYAHATDDFSVLNVVENSHTLKPMIYKISGVWGNHEGSMMLWIWMLSLWGFFVERAKKVPLPVQARVLAVQGMIGFGFILFVLLTSNPFLRVSPAPLEGMDLNPVLQDLGLAVHPPLLYAGYVGFSIAFCFAVAALIEKKVDSEWAALVRPWVLAAWVALTAGVASGAVWAYYELGWGGFWSWDPVENASLMPWLVGTALLHSVAVLEKRNALGNWTIFLSILAFSFSLLGTFLVRSGILTSVHAFASDPARGIFILALLTVAIGGAFLFYGWRAPQVKSGAGFSLVSRETALLLNNVFLFTFCMTVLMGTLYPLFLNALDMGSISVGPPYYMTTLLPLLAPFALLLGAAPLLAWKQGNLKNLSMPLTLTVMALVIFFPLLREKPLSLLGFGAGGWVVLATLHDVWKKFGNKLPRSYYGMALAHAGFGLLIIGITATTLWKEEKILWMLPGERVEIAGKQIALLGTQEKPGPNYEINTVIFSVDGGYMTPEKRWYPVQEKITSEVSLRLKGFGLLYLVLGDQDEKYPERWAVRAYYHPLALWILLGALMMAGGGALSFADKRRMS
jgi:cytochrome c-type biogenesis protein CcmF